MLHADMGLLSARKTYILLTGAVLLGCASPPSSNQSQNSNTASAKATIDSVHAQASVVDGNLTFGLDMFKRLAESRDKPEDNSFISPISISSAFGLAYAGAREDTATDISKTMSFDLPFAQQHKALGRLRTKLEDQTEGRLFDLANALFVDKSIKLEPDYKTLVQSAYDADETKVDYKKNRLSAIDTINSWVSDQTRGLINSVVSKETLPKTTRSTLVNTAYLKADWQSTFAPEATRTKTFHTPSGEILTPMMRSRKSLSYYKGNNFTAVDLPYKNNTMSMVVIRPKSVTGADKTLQQLTPKTVKTLFKSLDNAETKQVDISLPKADLAVEYILNNSLRGLGMTTPFSDSANFSGITTTAPLKVGFVIHKTVLKVDEKGTEAAAVTAIVEMLTTGLRRPPPKIIRFNVDRPYIIILRHKETNAVLFMGLINTPCPDGCESEP